MTAPEERARFAEHIAMKLRRMGRRARAGRASGFALRDDLLAIERGDVVVLSAPAGS